MVMVKLLVEKCECWQVHIKSPCTCEPQECCWRFWACWPWHQEEARTQRYDQHEVDSLAPGRKTQYGDFEEWKSKGTLGLDQVSLLSSLSRLWHIGNIFWSDVVYLGVDLHCQEKPEAGMRLHGVELLFQLHQPSRGQVDILQHHPPAGPKHLGYQYNQTKSTCSENIHLKNITHLPDLTAVLMSLSALLKPSAEPVNSIQTQTFINNILTKCLDLILFVCQEYELIPSLPIEIEVICLFCSAARSLTRPLAS